MKTVNFINGSKKTRDIDLMLVHKNTINYYTLTIEFGKNSFSELEQNFENSFLILHFKIGLYNMQTTHYNESSELICERRIKLPSNIDLINYEQKSDNNKITFVFPKKYSSELLLENYF